MSSYYTAIKDAERYYFSIGTVFCAGLSHTPVYFTRKGFRHFIRKNEKFRPIPDQLRRLKLLYYVVDLLKSNQVIIQHSKGKSFNFCSISKKISKNYRIKVVLIEANKGEYHFFSIMD